MGFYVNWSVWRKKVNIEVNIGNKNIYLRNINDMYFKWWVIYYYVSIKELYIIVFIKKFCYFLLWGL